MSIFNEEISVKTELISGITHTRLRAILLDLTDIQASKIVADFCIYKRTGEIVTSRISNGDHVLLERLRLHLDEDISLLRVNR